MKPSDVTPATVTNPGVGRFHGGRPIFFVLLFTLGPWLPSCHDACQSPPPLPPPTPLSAGPQARQAATALERIDISPCLARLGPDTAVPRGSYVTVRVSLGPSGQVARSWITASTLPHKGFETCLIGLLRSQAPLAAPSPAGPLELELGFTLTPAP